MAEQTGERTFTVNIGLDRLGLLALRSPMVSALVIAFVSLIAAVGVARLAVDDSLSELFRTDTPEFRQYEQIDRRFPSSEYDVLIAVSGRGLLTRDGLGAFRAAVTELQLVDGVGGLVSMLSARGRPDATGYAPPVVPEDIPDGETLRTTVEALRKNDIVAGKFLSDDGELALVVISLDRDAIEERGARAVIGEIRTTAAKALAPAGLTAELTGAPVMQLEIRNAVERDRLVYNGLGFLLGGGVAYLYFRRLSLTLIAVLGPTIAILWTLGAVGWLDWRLNLFVNVLTPLILVSGFSDSMHLVFAIRRDILAGLDRVEAATRAVREIAPACLLTAMNAALALVSFAWAESALIRTFGLAALMAVFISYVAVAVVVPTLAALLIRREAYPYSPSDEESAERSGWLGVAVRSIVGAAIARPAPFLIGGVVAVVLTGLAYGRLAPAYRLADQVPDKEQALAATGRLDQKLTGANPVHVMIQLPASATLYTPATMEVIAAAHGVLEKTAGLGNVWSIESLRRWLADAGDGGVVDVKRTIDVLPKHLVRRFIDQDERAVLVTGRLPDVDASRILPVVETIDRALEPVRRASAGYEISVTGLPAIAARNSAKLIGELNWGLVGDMFVIFIFLGLVLRSSVACVASILPSLFPIYATGALLWLTGEGLQFASIIAITVAFSLAIDSTIHFLNRFRIEEEKLGGAPGTAIPALMATADRIGPAVTLTTVVLALGLGVTILSDLPSLRLFGRLTAVCLFTSLVAQLLILPATIAIYRRYVPRYGWPT